MKRGKELPGQAIVTTNLNQCQVEALVLTKESPRTGINKEETTEEKIES